MRKHQSLRGVEQAIRRRFAWDVQGCDPNNLEKLVDALWQLYGSFIMAGEQSIDDFVWHRVTTDEIRTIEELVDAADEPAQRK